MVNWFYIGLRHGTTFAGRSNRKELAYFELFSFIILTALVIIDFLFNIMYDPELGYGLLSGCFAFVLALPTYRLYVHRLHDTNHSGWWILLVFIPVINILLFLYLFFKKGDPGKNKYGKKPDYSEYL